jgi:hypothetical protein
MKQTYIPKRERPYIGITDFTTPEQVRHMLNVFRRNRPVGSKRRLHVGVMMSYKTLHDIETQWSKAFPPKEKIREIFTPPEEIDPINRPNDMNDWMFTLHYADYDNSPFLFRDLMNALQYVGPFVDALQLDMPWPDPAAVANAVHASRIDGLEVILQVSARSMQMVDNNPDNVVEMLDLYQNFISHVLLDKSMGRGLGMDAQALLPYADAISEAYPHLQLVFAGGLGPESMHLLDPLLSKYPNMSIDAQGQLRPSKSALDPIDWDMAEQYLIKALQVLG